MKKLSFLMLLLASFGASAQTYTIYEHHDGTNYLSILSQIVELRTVDLSLCSATQGSLVRPRLPIQAQINEAPGADQGFAYAFECKDQFNKRAFVVHQRLAPFDVAVQQALGNATVAFVRGSQVLAEAHIDVYDTNTGRRVDVHRVDVLGSCRADDSATAVCSADGGGVITVRGSLAELVGFVTLPSL